MTYARHHLGHNPLQVQVLVQSVRCVGSLDQHNQRDIPVGLVGWGVVLWLWAASHVGGTIRTPIANSAWGMAECCCHQQFKRVAGTNSSNVLVTSEAAIAAKGSNTQRAALQTWEKRQTVENARVRKPLDGP
jgi:hypothetical protein